MQSKDCNFFKEQIHRYMSDQLNNAETTELLVHIESCPECMRELDILKAIISASASLPQIEVPDGLKASVFEKLGSSTQTITPKRYKFKRFASVAISAAACIALTIGAFSGGLYDKFVASDNIISSGKVNSAQVQTNTEQAGASENTEPTVTPSNVAPDTPQQTATAKKPTSQPKTEQRDAVATSVSQNNTADVDTASISEDITVTSDNAQTEGSIASGTTQSESSIADIPTVASVPPARARLIKEAPITDSEQVENNSIALTDGGSAEVKPRVPASCIIITENISAFSDKFGVTAEEGELHFELDADKWQDFLSFAENTGAELNADYSADGEAYVSITIRWENK